MTKLDRQQAAVRMAVTKAIYEIGLGTIKSGEFFGARQVSKPAEEQVAA